MEHFELGNTGIDPLIRTGNDRVPARFGHLNKIVDAVTALQEVPPGAGIESVVAGVGIDVDNTDPLNPIVSVDFPALNVDSGVFTPAYGDIMQITAPVLNYSGVWTRIGENITFGTQLTGDLSLAQTSGSFTITLPEIINNLVNDNISFIIGTYDNVLGTEKAIIYPNIGLQTATIEIEGYTAASTFFLFVTAIYKR